MAKYKAYKNKLNHLLRISERKYYYDKFELVKGKELPSIILSTCIKGFLKPLTHIINCSLNTGIVLDSMKIAKITPVFKTDDKQDLNNYRLISILPYFSKVIKRTMDFVTKSSILYDKKFGFR